VVEAVPGERFEDPLDVALRDGGEKGFAHESCGGSLLRRASQYTGLSDTNWCVGILRVRYRYRRAAALAVNCAARVCGCGPNRGEVLSHPLP
jgi:hypothetical protein